MKDTAFQSLLKPLTKELIAECVQYYRSDHGCSAFNTALHVQTMIFAQIHEIKSLRLLEAATRVRKTALKGKVKRATLSDANRKRPAQVFFWLLNKLISLLPNRKHKEIKEAVKLLDSSPIQLKGRGYDEWTKQHAVRQIQGLKLHVEYDLTLKAPTKTCLSRANYNDITIGQRWPIQPATLYVFDKGYYDFNWWWSIHQQGSWFVTRLKSNTAIRVIDKKETTGEILADQTILLKNKRPRGGKVNLYKDELRCVTIRRDKKSPLVLVTNRHDLPAETIASLYKSRWSIELFFKWIKQHLRVKKFLGEL